MQNLLCQASELHSNDVTRIFQVCMFILLPLVLFLLFLVSCLNFYTFFSWQRL